LISDRVRSGQGHALHPGQIQLEQTCAVDTGQPGSVTGVPVEMLGAIPARVHGQLQEEFVAPQLEQLGDQALHRGGRHHSFRVKVSGLAWMGRFPL
jgi:hypothetical protein